MIDIGINLTNKQLKNRVPQVLAEAKGVGVQHIILTGTSLSNSHQSLQLAKSHPDYLTTTVGIHPHNAKEFTTDTADKLKKMLADPLAVAVGECGLDFDRNFSSKKEQYEAFEAQLHIAKEMQKPLFLHERSAHKEFVSVMKNHTDVIPTSVVHCFTGTKDELKTYLDLGFFIGVTGWVCDSKRGLPLREALKYAPIDRLMIETDSPFLLPKNLHPMPHSRTNEPKYLRHIGKEIARIKGIEDDVFFEAVLDNTKRFFALK